MKPDRRPRPLFHFHSSEVPLTSGMQSREHDAVKQALYTVALSVHVHKIEGDVFLRIQGGPVKADKRATKGAHVEKSATPSR